ncbi:MAG TPA: alpha/beta hydrolase [Acidimicrobiales bacterium]
MTAPTAVEGRVTATDGVGIAYRDYGQSGRGLVLLHGGGANLESMDQFAERLGGSRRTVAIASDVAAVVRALDLGPVDVVGHSMGGFVAGFYGIANPDARVVSIDGFGPGMVTVGSDAERAEWRSFQGSMKAAFFAMTAPPESGDLAWRNEQVAMLRDVFPRIGYTAPNAAVMAERNFVDAGGGVYRRRPPRHLFADAFGDDGETDILRMYRHATCPTLIIRCTESGAPAVLDAELDALASANDAVRVVRLPLTHLAPAWDAIDLVVTEIERFLSR